MVNVIKEAQVLYNAKGRKTHVLLPYKTYAELIEQLEDAEDLRAMNEAESDEPNIPWKEFRKKISKKGR